MSIYNIALHQDFFCEFIAGFYNKISEEQVNEAVVFLPTLRACKLLERKFEGAGPKILPLTSVELAFFGTIEPCKEDTLSPSELKLLLIEFLIEKSKLSYLDALTISVELASFIARFEKDEISLSELDNVFLGDIPMRAEYIFSSLKIVAKEWNLFLAERNGITETQRRNTFIGKLIDKWQITPPKHHVIIAGSVGTFSSTKKLIKAVSALPRGHVILHGIEHLQYSGMNLEENHPCYQLEKIVNHLDIEPSLLKYWGNNGNGNSSKLYLNRFLAGDQSSEGSPSEDLLDNFSYYECDSIHDEIKIIVDKVSELDKVGIKNIGIIVNDRSLGNRLVTSLELHNFIVESQHGISILSSSQMAFILAILKAWIEKFSPITLLNLVQHDLFIYGDKEQSIAKLEINYLRGIRKYQSLEELVAICESDFCYDIVGLLNKLLTSYKILESIDLTNYSDILRILMKISESLSIDDVNNQIMIWHDDQGQGVFEVLNNLLPHLLNLRISIEFFESTLSRLLEECKLNSPQQDLKIKVLSAVESRLLKFDYVILAGMNDRGWSRTGVDVEPFLGAILYNQLGLDSHKIRLGQSARDFIFLLQNKNVFITRSRNQDNTPQNPYRLLNKIEIWAQKYNIIFDIKHSVNLSNHGYLKNELYNKPEPRPPVLLRPQKLSVTQVEKLLRDPYSIYASLILKLVPLQPIDKLPGNLEFGNLIHSALHIFNKTYNGNGFGNLMKIFDLLLLQLRSNATIEKIWRPRLAKIANWVSQYEKDVRKVSDVSTEVKVSGEIECYSITAKIDRVENHMEKIRVIDFKTGALPTKEDVKNGFSPQLPLEALVSNYKGGIELVYIKLGAGMKIGQMMEIEEVGDLIEKYKEGIKNVFKQYTDANTPYLVCPIMEKCPIYNEYEHLERIREIHFIS